MEENLEGAHDGGPPPRRTAGGAGERQAKSEPLPVWFFVGIIFVIYGAMIFVTGLTEISHPPATVLSDIHPAIWWGAVILAVGCFFVYRFGPWRMRQ